MTRPAATSHLARSFAPLVRPGCRALVLGSMPGVASLEAARYYAHPKNLFWPLMGELLGFSVVTDYEGRCDALLRSGVALWDVLAECEREGSLDSRIAKGTERPNDIRGLLADHPSIGFVLCNGAKAASAFRKHIGEMRAELIALPSTSPANASVPLATKRDAWRSAFGRAGVRAQGR